jgi:hypothetical protein
MKNISIATLALVLGTAASASANPLTTLTVPSGFGAQKGQLYVTSDYQTHTRGLKVSDGEVGIGYGVTDNIEINATANSFGLNNNGGKIGDGSISAKIHARIDDSASVAVGYNAVVSSGVTDRQQGSYYGVVTKVIATKENVSEDFSRVAITAGVGGGEFNKFDKSSKPNVANYNPSLFAAVAVKVKPNLAAIVEYKGNDLAVGVSYAATDNLTINAAVVDIAKEPRIVAGLGFRF